MTRHKGAATGVRQQEGPRDRVDQQFPQILVSAEELARAVLETPPEKLDNAGCANQAEGRENGEASP